MVKGLQKRFMVWAGLSALSAVVLLMINNIVGILLLSESFHMETGEFLGYFDKILLGLFLFISASLGYSLLLNAGQFVEQEKRAVEDDITQLPSLTVFNQDMVNILCAKKPENDYVMVAVDIDKFKVVNEFFGFSHGTRIIRLVGNMLSGNMNADEKCYRVGNDLFYLLLKSHGRESDYQRIRDILDNILIDLVAMDPREYTNNVNGGIYNHVLSFSAGGVIISVNKMQEYFSGTAESIAEQGMALAAKIADNANIARKKGKYENKNSVYIFDDSMRQAILEDKKIEDAFLLGIERGEFLIYYQPKFYIGGDEAVHGGAEALIRWESGELGFMPPGKFIPLFERDGNATRFDMHVMDLVCRNICEWRAMGLEVLPISINVSRPTILNGPGYLAFVREKLFLYDIPQDLIEFEILESSSDVDEDIVVEFINKIHGMGFKVSIDDFGTGCSSLGLLRRIPLDTLKLDKSFFDDMRLDMTEEESAVIRYMIMMAKTMGFRTIAEGIEEKFQVDILREFGCDMVQGYYFSRPIIADEYEKMLKMSQ